MATTSVHPIVGLGCGSDGGTEHPRTTRHLVGAFVKQNNITNMNVTKHIYKFNA